MWPKSNAAITRILNLVPEDILLWAYPRGRAFDHLREKAKENVRQALASDSVADEKVTSLFHHVVHTEMPAAEKSEERLVKEAQLLLAGGTFTSARTIGVAAYYILSQQQLHGRLTAVLREPMSLWPEQVPTWADLGKTFRFASHHQRNLAASCFDICHACRNDVIQGPNVSRVQYHLRSDASSAQDLTRCANPVSGVRYSSRSKCSRPNTYHAAWL